MKHLTVLFIGVILLGILFHIQYSITKDKNQLIKAYNQYYSNTETLLDELDSAYNWVDGHDDYEYYSSKAKVDSLTNNIQ